MASKEVPSAAWVKAMIEPVSSLGRKPLGTTTKSPAVAKRISARTAIARPRRPSTQSRVRV